MRVKDTVSPKESAKATIHLEALERLDTLSLFQLHGHVRKELKLRTRDAACSIPELINKYAFDKCSDYTFTLNDNGQVDVTVIRPIDITEWAISDDEEVDLYELRSLATDALGKEIEFLVDGTCFTEQSISAFTKDEELMAKCYSASMDHPQIREHLRLIHQRHQSRLGARSLK